MLALVQAHARDANVSAAFGISHQSFAFDELNPGGRRLVREHGPLPGVVAAISRVSARTVLQAALSHHRGAAHYHGHTQSGVPLDSTTDESITEMILAGTRRGPRGAIYAGFGQRRWERDIAGRGRIAGLEESYRWTFLLGGVRVAFARGWQIDARLTYPLDAELKADFGGSYDEVEIALDKALEWRVALPVEMDVGARSRLGVELYVHGWDAERSDKGVLTRAGAPVASVHEPASAMRVAGVNVTYGWDF